MFIKYSFNKLYRFVSQQGFAIFFAPQLTNSHFMKFVLFFLATLVVSSTAADTLSSRQAIDRFIHVFNQEDVDALSQLANAPWFTIVDGVTTSYDAYGDMVDFAGLKKTGWSYSRTRNIETLHDDGNTAFINALLERLDSDDQVIFSGEIIFALVRDEGQWKIAGWISSGNRDIPLGK